MEFRIADTFTDSLARLTGDEQKAVKTTAFDLQLNPASPGMSFHKLDKAKDKNFWSVRVSADIRLIVHKTAGSLLLCYVDHHDKAYDWAERRKLETHPKTGAAQLVEIRETVKEIVVPVYVQAERPGAVEAAAVCRMSDEELLGYGVPAEWLDDVRRADEDSLLVLADHLPGEAAEALLELATGGSRAWRRPAAPVANPFDHPDAQRRFRVMTNVEELQRALDFPGRNGRSSCTRSSGSGSSATTPARRASPAPPAPARPSSRCIAPRIWRARIRSARAAGDLLRHAGECAAHEAEATGRQRAAPCRTDRRPFSQRPRPSALQSALSAR